MRPPEPTKVARMRNGPLYNAVSIKFMRTRERNLLTLVHEDPLNPGVNHMF